MTTPAEALPYPSDDPHLVTAAADRCRRVAAVAALVGDQLARDAVLLAAAWSGPAALGCRAELGAATELVRAVSEPLQRSAVELRAHGLVLLDARAQVDRLREDYGALVAAQQRELSALLRDTSTPGPARRLRAADALAAHQLELAALHRRHQHVLDRVTEHARATGRRIGAAAESLVPRRGAGGRPVSDREAALAAALPLLAASRRAAGADAPPPAAGSAPQLVRLWWAALTSDERSRALLTWPVELGSLDGLPGAARSAANERRLAQDVAALRRREKLTPDQRRWLDNCLVVRAQLALARAVRGTGAGPPTAQLLVFDPTAFGYQGRAAIAVGDVDTADNVAFLVPGLGSDIHGGMARLTGNAVRVASEARRIAPGATTATVAWMGYDAPGFTSVASDDAAEHGATLLATDVLAVQASRDVAPHLSVVAHSYGTTTAGLALRDAQTGTDDLVLVGSPGPGVEDAGDLQLPSGHVFVGANSRDLVSYLDRFGKDPSHASFGAVRFEAEDVTRGSWHLEFGDHTKYFNAHSESLANIGQVVVGDYAGVVRAPYRGEVFLLPDGINDDPESDREPTTVP
jgi:hypothetical protein